MNENEKSPLKELVVKEETLNEKLLAELLKTYISIEENTGELIPTESFNSLSAEGKVIIAFLYSKAKKRLNMSSTEKLKPKDIESILGLKGNTIRPILKKLKEEGIIKLDEEGYWIPNVNLYRAKRVLENVMVRK
jgi:DNA-binding transcriptional ArsR family regulator